eukprot:scaffold35885_cov65-Phaeocystis_antarctica.AAC.4
MCALVPVPRGARAGGCARAAPCSSRTRGLERSKAGTLARSKTTREHAVAPSAVIVIAAGEVLAPPAPSAWHSRSSAPWCSRKSKALMLRSSACSIGAEARSAACQRAVAPDGACVGRAASRVAARQLYSVPSRASPSLSSSSTSTTEKRARLEAARA